MTRSTRGADMTRDEIEFLAKHEMFTTFSRAFLNHDAKQRRVIELLRKELALLKQDDAERFTLIRDMEQEERRKDREIEQARRTAEYWKAEHLAGNKKIEQQAQQIATLREALEKIVDVLGGDSACRLAHHGLCQEHFLTMPCEVAEAQQALKETVT